MPIVLKFPSKKSPGIISFTDHEVLFGVVSKFRSVKKFINEMYNTKKWIFGIHVNGDPSWYGKWKREEWQEFFMWPNSNDEIFKNINSNLKTELCCINFYKKKIFKEYIYKKNYDICSITRFSSIKKIDLTINIYKNLLKINPNLKLLLIATYPKSNVEVINSKEDRYIKNTLYKIKYSLSHNEKKRIDFICSPEDLFGNFPLTDNTIYNLISLSKNLLLTSHQEGTPRVIIEAICLNTKIIFCKRLKSGINTFLNKTNSFAYKDDNVKPRFIAKQIYKYINLKSQNINKSKDNIENFSEEKNIPKLKIFFERLINSKNLQLNKKERWYLHDLNKRLACHSNSFGLTFYNNDKAFFNWFKKINKNDSVIFSNEEGLYEEAVKLDKKKNFLINLIFYINYKINRFKTKILKIS